MAYLETILIECRASNIKRSETFEINRGFATLFKKQRRGHTPKILEEKRKLNTRETLIKIRCVF